MRLVVTQSDSFVRAGVIGLAVWPTDLRLLHWRCHSVTPLCGRIDAELQINPPIHLFILWDFTSNFVCPWLHSTELVSTHAAVVSCQVILCCNLIAVKFGLLVPAKLLVEKDRVFVPVKW